MLTQKGVVLVSTLVVAVFIGFAIVAFEPGSTDFIGTGIVGTSAKMEFAFTWTLRAAGSLIAIFAAIHLVLFAVQRDSTAQIVPGGIALLGGLLLLGQQHWHVVTAFGVLSIAFIIQQLIIRRAPVQAMATEPTAGNKGSPVQEVAGTGIQAGRR
jgi:hypothetical protein